MHIYSKSMKNATSPLFRNHNRSALEAGTYITHRVIYYPLVSLSFVNSFFSLILIISHHSFPPFLSHTPSLSHLLLLSFFHNLTHPKKMAMGVGHKVKPGLEVPPFFNLNSHLCIKATFFISQSDHYRQVSLYISNVSSLLNSHSPTQGTKIICLKGVIFFLLFPFSDSK